jgi:hypothetical protein
MRSLWQIATFIRDGALEQVLPEIPTPAADVFAVYPSVSHPPCRNLGRRTAPRPRSARSG